MPATPRIEIQHDAMKKIIHLISLMLVMTILTGATAIQAQVAPAAVTNLQLSSTAPGELTISWDVPDPVPTDYRVMWARQDLDYLSYKATNEAHRGNNYPSGDQTSITLTGLTKGGAYKVQARTRYRDGHQSGPWSSEVTGRVKNDPPSAPTGLTASQITHESVTLAWAAPATGSPSGYRILRGPDTANLTTLVADTGKNDTGHTDNTVAAETTYHYAVVALSPDGDSPQSSTVNATTLAAPTPPAFVSAAVNGTTLVITFDKTLDSAATLSNEPFIVQRTPQGREEETLRLTGTPTISGATVTLTLSSARRQRTPSRSPTPSRPRHPAPNSPTREATR